MQMQFSHHGNEFSYSLIYYIQHFFMYNICIILIYISTDTNTLIFEFSGFLHLAIGIKQNTNMYINYKVMGRGTR